ncbi:MAG: hypothetical protein KGL31_01810 [candidate division NC10 bacterium]|nr:hypothetical protein [candidate division NC10 bacterium]MDE2320641.1 hypothetical protein [candidate division NC10 bacterium]
MRIVLRVACFGLLLAAAWLIRVPFAMAENACIDCHKALKDERLNRPAIKIKDDYHLARGLSCHNCHGGDPTALDNKAQAHSPAKGFLGKPKRRAIPEACGKCHSDPRYMRQFNPSIRTDQVKEYYTSVHGKRLREGDQKVAVCISCHDVHAIRAVKDQMAWTYPTNVAETCSRCHGNAEYMKAYKIPTDQFEKYKQSVHYEMLTKRADLASPTCSSCHGSHGAAPPGVDSVANVCSHCHVATAELFAKSPHKSAFADLGMPACVTCHSNHDITKPSDAMLGGGEGTPCATCHEAGSAPLKKAAELRTMIEGLSSRIDQATTILTKAERAGMEIGAPRFELIAATESLIKARSAIHSLEVGQIKAATDSGSIVAQKSLESGQGLLAEVQFRRKGLAASMLVIVAVLVGLFFKIRDVDRRGGPD